MNINYDNIPDELKRLKQWCCWCGDKMPKNPYTGQNAQSNNPDTWSDFETAVKAVEKYHFDGIGFQFANGYFGVDLDHCLDDVDFVDEFVETLQSYTEFSKSGNGIHIICKGKLPEGRRRRGNVEMYCTGRYFIMTGNVYNEKYKTIKDCTESIKVLHSKYLFEETPKVAPKTFQVVDLSEQEIIDKARNCKTGGVFQLLYSGQWQGLYSSQSEADLALCNHLAFWCQKDAYKMDRIFRTSGLMREKWDKLRGQYTYGQKTIEQAISHCVDVYEPQTVKNDTEIALAFFGKGQDGVAELPKNHYDMTDTGNAQRLKDKYKGNIKYSYVRKKWYYWTGKIWAVDNTGEIKKLADEIINDIKKEAFMEKDEDKQQELLKWASKTASSKGKEAMVKETQHIEGIPILMEELDCYTDYLNCQNGIVNLRTGELLPHDSNFMMSRISYAEYDASGKEPKMWLSFLDDVTNGDKDLQAYLQKCVGYSLTGSIREQCAFFLYGIGNNGKSTFLDTISDLLGSYASNVQPDTIMMRKNDSGANSDIARLKSTRFVTSEEPTEGVRLNEGLVKQLTGGGKVTCRFLYGDEFEYEPEFKIWIGTNHKPVIRGTDVGIWRRIRLIPFEVNIPKEKVDKNMKYKLRKELPQILKWAVDGCIKWQNEGLTMPSCVEKATAEYKVEMDILANFIDSCLEIDYVSGVSVSAQDLFNLYSAWAKKNNEFEMTSRKFFIEIGKKLPEKVRKSNGIFYPKIKETEYAQSLLNAGASKQYKFSDFN